MYSLTVTIGRNVPDMHDQRDDVTGERIQAPMPLVHWETFVDEVAELLTSFAVTDNPEFDEDAVEVHYGRGVWDGVEEDSAKVTLLSHGTLNASENRRLNKVLTNLRHKYNQDAIAVTTGTSTLI